MSIGTMTRLASEAARRDSARSGQPIPAGTEAALTPTVGGARVTAASDPRSSVQSALDAIVAWIPSEALAIYIAALGILPPANATERWAWFVVGIIAVLVFAVVGGLDRQTRTPTGKLVLVTLVAAASFATYAAALPSSPFIDFGARATAVAGIVAIGLSLLLPRVARILGIAPES